MTERLAKEIFDSIIDEISLNNLTDIITFALPGNETKANFQEYSADHQFRDTYSELNFLIRMSDDYDGGARRALRQVVRAGTFYFSRVSDLTANYGTRLTQLFSNTGHIYKDRITMTAGETNNIDISARLEQPEIRKLKTLFEFIDENQYLDDDIFLAQLDNLLAEL